MTCQSSSHPRPAPFASFFAGEALELATLTRRLSAWGHRAEIAVQAKRYSAPVGRRFVDELLGVFRRQRYAEALLVTTSEFSAQAVQAAQGEPNLMLAAHGVLLQVGRFGELKRQSTRAG